MSLNHGAINCGHGRGGNIHLHGFDKVLAAVSDQSTVTAVFDNPETAATFIIKWHAMEMGLSVTLSAMFEASMECCRKAHITPHSIKHSIGIWGNTNRLPKPDILKITTMCGHGLVSPYLVEKCIDDIRKKKMTALEASKILAKPCLCGVFNLTRSVVILEMLSGSRACGTEDPFPDCNDMIE
jgi:hypothetical protein